MRKKDYKHLYTAERYFFSAAIAMFARQRKSIYEMALLLEAHTDLIVQFAITDEIRALLRESNDAFINWFNAEYPDPVQKRDAYWKHFILFSPDGRCFFCRHSPKTLDYWLKKNKNGEEVFQKVLASDDTDALTCNSNPAYISPGEKTESLNIPLRKTFEIINAILNGNSFYRIKTKYHCSAKQLHQLQFENNLPATVSTECIIQRILETLKAGADYEFIKDQFPSVSDYQIKKIMMDYKNGKQIIPLKTPVKRTVKVFKKVTVTRSNEIKTIYRFSSRKVALLQQKICVRHFSLGNDPEQIAAIMCIERPLVVALLRKSGAIA